MKGKEEIVRFCRIADPRQTGSMNGTTGEVEVIPSFIINEIYTYDAWNSSSVFTDSQEFCWQLMRHNGTDILPFAIPFPMLDHVNKMINYLTIMRESKNLMLSSYKPVKGRTENTDALSALNSFTPIVAVIIMIYVLIFYLLFDIYSRISHKMRKNNKKSEKSQKVLSKVMTGLMLKQGTAVARIPKKKSFKLILLFYTLLVASLHFSFSAFAKTELVIVGESFLLDTYEKIVQHMTAIPSWITYETVYESFLNSPKDSVKHRMWEKAEQKDKCISNPKKCLLPLTANDISDVVKDISSRKRILITGETAGNLLSAAICPLADLMALDPIIRRTDPSEEAIAESLTIRKGMKSEIEKSIKSRAMRTSQSGIIEMLIVPKDFPLEKMASYESFRNCFVNDVKDSKDKGRIVIDKSWLDYKYLVLIYLLMNGIAILVELTYCLLRCLCC